LSFTLRSKTPLKENFINQILCFGTSLHESSGNHCLKISFFIDITFIFQLLDPKNLIKKIKTKRFNVKLSFISLYPLSLAKTALINDRVVDLIFSLYSIHLVLGIRKS